MNANRPTRRWGRRFALGVAGLTFGVVLLYAPGCLGRLIGGKYDGPTNHGLAGPRELPDTPVRVEQTLPHTCGLRAMEAAYTAYGLDPDRRNIRYRLGTDFSAVPVDPESTGTLHPDILRVLAQDGFATTVLDFDQDNAADRLAAHLNDGQLALTVVYRSTYHWMLLAPPPPEARPPEGAHGDVAGELWVIDSLAEGHTAADIKAFIEDEALSVILIEPRGQHEQEPSRSRQHMLGTQEMARTYQRQREHEAR